jgi:hypothetical protein
MRQLIIAAGLIGALGLIATTADARGGHGGGGGYSSGRSSSSSSSSYGHVNSSYHSVSGYTRRDGTYVHSYKATDPNSTRNDNYSTRGNKNPWTGEPGTKPLDGE